jgi:hypothetical protein
MFELHLVLVRLESPHLPHACCRDQPRGLLISCPFALINSLETLLYHLVSVEVIGLSDRQLLVCRSAE